jgi:hypothetical protein
MPNAVIGEYLDQAVLIAVNIIKGVHATFHANVAYSSTSPRRDRAELCMRCDFTAIPARYHTAPVVAG